MQGSEYSQILSNEELAERKRQQRELEQQNVKFKVGDEVEVLEAAVEPHYPDWLRPGMVGVVTDIFSEGIRPFPVAADIEGRHEVFTFDELQLKSKPESVVITLNDTEIKAIATVHGWTFEKAANYLARIQLVTREGFTEANYASQQDKLKLIDKAYGMQTDDEFITGLEHVLDDGLITFRTALTLWTGRIRRREG